MTDTPIAPLLVKPLVWTDPAPPTNGVSFYDHTTTETVFGKITIEWKGWKESSGFGAQMPWDCYIVGDTLSDAKAAVQADHDTRILAALEPAPVTVQEAAKVLLDTKYYSVMAVAFDAMEKVDGEGVDTMLAAGLRALAQEPKP